LPAAVAYTGNRLPFVLAAVDRVINGPLPVIKFIF